jgi:lipopolysaccharide export system protein LptA
MRNHPLPSFQARRPVSAAMLAVVCLLHPGWAIAEKADRDKPVTVEADRMQYDDLQQVSTFSGRVILNKGTIEIRADQLVLRQDAQGWQYGTATGNLASFRQKREGADEWVEGRASRIDYDGRKETALLRQRAMMQRTDASGRVLDEIHGNEILYESLTEVFTVDGGAEGRTPANPSGRVRMVIQPRKAEDKAPATPPPPVRLKPAGRLGPDTR